MANNRETKATLKAEIETLKEEVSNLKAKVNREEKGDENIRRQFSEAIRGEYMNAVKENVFWPPGRNNEGSKTLTWAHIFIEFGKLIQNKDFRNFENNLRIIREENAYIRSELEKNAPGKHDNGARSVTR